jgi:methylated-DNA-[protein]-cysteine S-methyltransferase
MNGRKKAIHTVIQPVGITPFTLEVHKTIARIPYGETMTYGEVAEIMGRPGAARAVGNACGQNKALIAVPCHRVVAANGIGGFGGRIDLKYRLLEHENGEY